MSGITRKHLDSVFELFCKQVPAPDGGKWVLVVNSPGDGKTRFGLFAQPAGESYLTEPLGCMYWLGRTEAYHTLVAMTRVAEYLKSQPNPRLG